MAVKSSSFGDVGLGGVSGANRLTEELQNKHNAGHNHLNWKDCRGSETYRGNADMFRSFAAFTTLLTIGYLSSMSSAEADMTFRLVSQASGKCLRLQNADQDDGGGLTAGECKNFPDFFVTAVAFSLTPLQFRLNSSRFVCVFATEEPVLGQHPKVMTRNCDALPNSNWKILSADANGFRHIEKCKGIDCLNFCMQENRETSEVELEQCQVPAQKWKLELITLPPEQ